MHSSDHQETPVLSGSQYHLSRRVIQHGEASQSSERIADRIQHSDQSSIDTSVSQLTNLLEPALDDPDPGAYTSTLNSHQAATQVIMNSMLACQRQMESLTWRFSPSRTG